MELAVKTSAIETRESETPGVDISSPEKASRVLGSLRAHLAELSPAERKAYDRLRDGIVLLARKQVSEASLSPDLTLLSKFIQSPASRVPSALDQIVSNENSEAVHEAPQKKNPPLRFMDRTRIKPVTARTLEVRPLTPPQASNDTIDSAPSASVEQTPAVPLAVAEVPAIAQEVEPAESPVVAREEVPAQKESLRTISQEVEAVNAELNKFADGKAFQWLHNPKSGYREYMQDLMSLRKDLSAVSAETTDAMRAEFSSRLEALRQKALAVEEAVGKKRLEPAPVASPVTASDIPSALAVPSQPVVAEKVQLKVNAVPAPEVTPVVQDSPLAPQAWMTTEERAAEKVEAKAEEKTATVDNKSPLNIEPETKAEVKQGHVIENKADALNTMSADVAESAPVAPVPEAFPPVDVSTEKNAIYDAVLTPRPEVAPAPPAPAEVASEIPVPPAPIEAPSPDTELYTPAVEKALDHLLTEWLGGKGWLGLKKGGVNHPDWKVMASLRVEDVIQNDGFVPQGLSHELMLNLDENIRAWAKLYSIPLSTYAQSTVDQLLHKIVFESLQKTG